MNEGWDTPDTAPKDSLYELDTEPTSGPVRQDGGAWTTTELPTELGKTDTVTLPASTPVKVLGRDPRRSHATIYATANDETFQVGPTAQGAAAGALIDTSIVTTVTTNAKGEVWLWSNGGAVVSIITHLWSN